MNTNPTSGPCEVEDGTFTVSAPDSLEHLPSHHCAPVPDCGACPGDGSICKTSRKVAEESPPIDVQDIKAQLRTWADAVDGLGHSGLRSSQLREAADHIEALEKKVSQLAELGNAATEIGAECIKDLQRQLAEASKDAARLKWLHGTNKDADGYEYGVAKMRSMEDKTEWLWCLSDHSDIDAAMKEQA